MKRRNRHTFMGLVVVVAATGCERIDAVLDDISPVPATPRDAYVASLSEAGLAGSALAVRWVEAADAAMRSPVHLDPPFEEVAFYPAEEPTASSYVVSIDRGHSIRVSYSTDPPASGGVFLDVYRVEEGGGFTPVAFTRPDAADLEFEPAEAGEFLVRVQPELLRDVSVRLRVVKAAVLAFPVDGYDTGAIQSRYGAERDAGRREHQGVDIFAPRGTAVLAASDGVVSRVGDQRLGGRVVWVRDERRGTSQYYAHLDRQLVERGQLVRAGDTLGLVGNTGNARTTPPHLHFGLYVRRGGPIDPFNFLFSPPSDPPRLRADSTRLGQWVRTQTEASITLASAGGESTEEALASYTVVRVLGASGRDLRVRLPDGRFGLLRGGVEPLDIPIDETVLAAGDPILSEPHPAAPQQATSREASRMAVVGRFSDYLMVRPDDGPEAWVAARR
jgi:murein DD-endopeptidase MepM/ murein hydrolase activator NlpD